MPRSTVIETTYEDPRTGERWRESRIEEIPDEEIDNVRQRELAMVLAPRRDDQDQGYPNYYTRRGDYEQPRRSDPYGRRDDYYATSRSRQDNNYLAVDTYNPQRARSHRGASSRRRSPSSSSSDSGDDRKRRGHRRTRSAKPAPERADESDDGGIAWYSGKARKDCNFLERHFDSSYDGLIAAAAGAAIGAMTARRFVHKEGDEAHHKKLKTIGGAVLGAASFNSAENHYRMFTEEKVERRKEEKVERRQEERAEN